MNQDELPNRYPTQRVEKSGYWQDFGFVAPDIPAQRFSWEKMLKHRNLAIEVVEFPAHPLAVHRCLVPCMRDLVAVVWGNLSDYYGRNYFYLLGGMFGLFQGFCDGDARNWLAGSQHMDDLHIEPKVCEAWAYLEWDIPPKEGVIHFMALPTDIGELLAGYSGCNARESAGGIGGLVMGMPHVLALLISVSTYLPHLPNRPLLAAADQGLYEGTRCATRIFKSSEGQVVIAPENDSHPFRSEWQNGIPVVFPGKVS